MVKADDSVGESLNSDPDEAAQGGAGHGVSTFFFWLNGFDPNQLSIYCCGIAVERTSSSLGEPVLNSLPISGIRYTCPVILRRLHIWLPYRVHSFKKARNKD
jgi:hypothetical protein